jgi:hypothetical protein
MVASISDGVPTLPPSLWYHPLPPPLPRHSLTYPIPESRYPRQLRVGQSMGYKRVLQLVIVANISGGAGCYIVIFVRLVTLLFFVGRCEAALTTSDSFRLLPLLLALLGCFVSTGTGPLRKSGSSSESSGVPKCGHCQGETFASQTRLQLAGQWVRLGNG